MNYIFLIAGKGNRLHPLTLGTPKPLYKLDKRTTVLERMINLISEYDSNSKFTVVTGFMASEIEKRLQKHGEIRFIRNPFYEFTNSIASLWFARDMLNDEVTIINGDIVMDMNLIQEVVCQPVNSPMVLVDSSIKNNGDYNVQVLDNKILVMSKNLEEYYGEYAGITKLDQKSAIKLAEQVNKMINEKMYDQWYENALVQMIFDEDFILGYKDISNYKWTEVDCVDDMLLAKKIHHSERI